jgi:predicted RNA-binding protein associated with RNAse of E/G family
MALVKIHYRRPPDRISVYDNELVYSSDEVIVTIMRSTPLPRPMIVNDRVVFESGAPAVWFTFPDADYDVGRFHTADGVFTGLYANVLTPVEIISPSEWRTTDLFIDVWADLDGSVHVLDEDELDDAAERGWIDSETTTSARATAYRIAQEFREGTWPPPVVYDWPLERITGNQT